MATIAIDVKVSTRFPALQALTLARAAAAIEKAALDIEAQAKSRAPVDTGLLRNSINASPTGPLEWTVESPVSYSVYQEFGTRKMPAHPYMLPAVEFVKPSLESAFRRLV